MECIEQLAGTEKFSKKSKKRLEEQQMCLKRKSWSFDEFRKEKDRLRIQMVGLGDVGQNVAIGLTLLGGDQIESIGLYDLNQAPAFPNGTGTWAVFHTTGREKAAGDSSCF